MIAGTSQSVVALDGLPGGSPTRPGGVPARAVDDPMPREGFVGAGSARDCAIGRLPTRVPPVTCPR